MAESVQDLVEILVSGWRVELTAALLKSYLFALDGIPIAAVEEAVKGALRGAGGVGAYAPSPPDLRRLALDAQTGGRRLAASYHRKISAGGQIGGFLAEGDTRTQEQREREQTEAARAREEFGRVVGRIGRAMP